jgi:ferredoxin-NADP reductase
MSAEVIYGTDQSIENFAKIVPNRRRVFEEAPDTPIEKEPHINRLAAMLHPRQQLFLVSDIVQETSDVATYTLKPRNPSDRPAYFTAGQYLSIKLAIGNSHITRPYSISSSPGEALKGYYTLTIKNARDGFASRYIHQNWRVGTEVETSGPEGHFCYNELRDARAVIGIAGGSGITPFYSMAKDIVSGNSDFDLTILFGCRTEEEILFRDKLADLERHSKGKLRVAHVLSDEEKSGYECGFVTADIIKKYGPDSFSVFVCGPQQMYTFLRKELNSLNLATKYVRSELFGQPKNVYEMADYPQSAKDKVFSLTLKADGETKILPAAANESILVAIERSGLRSSSCCRSCECGLCRGRLLSGNVYETQESHAVRMADRIHGILHSCCAYPISDIEFELL